MLHAISNQTLGSGSVHQKVIESIV